MVPNVTFDTEDSYWKYFRDKLPQLYETMRHAGFIGDVEEDISLMQDALKLKDHKILIHLIEGLPYRVRSPSQTIDKFIGAVRGFPSAS